MRPRLSLRDALPQQVLQILHIIVLVLPDYRAGKADSESYTRVIQLIGDDQASFRYQSR